MKITQESIDLSYRGSGWDPNGGPITYSISGESSGQSGPQASFNGVLRIRYWPQRTSIPIAQSRQNTNGYCWGELTARQGSSVASSGIVGGKWAGWVIWSGDPQIHSGEAWCDGEEETFFHTSQHPIVVFGFFPRNPAHAFTTGFRVYNLDAPGGDSGLLVLRPGDPLSVAVRRSNVCVRVVENTSAILTVSTTSPTGPCNT